MSYLTCLIIAAISFMVGLLIGFGRSPKVDIHVRVSSTRVGDMAIVRVHYANITRREKVVIAESIKMAIADIEGIPVGNVEMKESEEKS